MSILSSRLFDIELISPQCPVSRIYGRFCLAKISIYSQHKKKDIIQIVKKNKMFNITLTQLLKVNESQYKQCGVTPHFSTGKNQLKKILRKDKCWHNQLKKAF